MHPGPSNHGIQRTAFSRGCPPRRWGDEARGPRSSRREAPDVSGRTFAAQRIFGDLGDNQMRVRPGQGLNSPVWLLWHMARTEDVAVNLVVAGGEQVLDED